MHLEDLAAHEEIRQLMYRYAQAVDRLDTGLLASCLAEDAEILVPGQPTLSGPDVPGVVIGIMRERFIKTQHRVFNTLYQLGEGNAGLAQSADGECYCTASHILASENGESSVNHEMFIRYRDRLLKLDGQWKIRRRELLVDWEERRKV